MRWRGATCSNLDMCQNLYLIDVSHLARWHCHELGWTSPCAVRTRGLLCKVVQSGFWSREWYHHYNYNDYILKSPHSHFAPLYVRVHRANAHTHTHTIPQIYRHEHSRRITGIKARENLFIAINTGIKDGTVNEDRSFDKIKRVF